MKRVFDLFMSTAALLLLAPIFIILAIAIRLQDGGPSFFGQVRVGKDGREFRMWKFRSMVVNADRIGGYSTAVGDPRITTLGRFIRRMSLDELPQLLNVLVGDMSLVGPRPDVPAQRCLYASDAWAVRHSVRPGITGLAQALLRSTGTESDRLMLDLRYVNERSFLLDLKIIALTIKRLSGTGAN